MVCLLPLLTTLSVYGVAWRTVRALRNIGWALVRGVDQEVESFLADRVQVGVNEYARGPRAVTAAFGRGPVKAEDVECLELHPLFDPLDPQHAYVEPIYKREMPGRELYRFRLTPLGWKLDGVLGWG